MDTERAIAISKLEAELCELYREKSKLNIQSYSQSDPGAVMDRRWVRRAIESKERTLETLKSQAPSKP